MTQSSTTPQRLYLMQLGTSTIPTTPQPTPTSAGCYLVQTSDGKNILIDSGLPAGYTPPPGTPPTGNEKNVLEHLAALGLHPDDIDFLICTHFDVDHAGYHLDTSRFWCACRRLARCCWRLTRCSSSAFLPLIERPGRLRTRSNCAPAHANSWTWSNASMWPWSSLVMMVYSGKRSRKHQLITSDTLAASFATAYVTMWQVGHTTR